jgi:hypothetical protein
MLLPRCANYALCRSRLPFGPLLISRRGLCCECDATFGTRLEISSTDDECPVCYERMRVAVKWNAEGCVHSFCAGCFHRMVYGAAQPAARTDAEYRAMMECETDSGDEERRELTARDTCPVCLRQNRKNYT